jgi:hypothetical protein
MTHHLFGNSDGGIAEKVARANAVGNFIHRI